MIKGFGKRGISPIIATVLILIITFVAVSILAVFVIPFVNNSLSGSQECFGVLGEVSFDESVYNCHASNGANINRTGFSIRVDGEEVARLKIGLYSGGSSDVIEIENDTNGASLAVPLRMLTDNDADGSLTDLVIPNKGGVRTYVATGIFDKIEVGAVLKSGKVCDFGDSIETNQCVNDEAINSLLSS